MTTAKKEKKFLNKTSPLFPGYLFLGTSIDPVPWRGVNGTRGVSKAVTLDGVYRPVNNHIIEGLKSRCDKHGIMQRLNDIVPGDRIKIESGPFADFVCCVDKIKNDHRAWVLLHLLQQEVRVQVSLENISKIS